MRSSWIVRLLLLGFSVVCAGTLVNGLDYRVDVRGSIPPNQLDGQNNHWFSLLRRNVGQMLTKRDDRQILEKRDGGIISEEGVAKFDMVRWSTETVRACAAKFNSTSESSNPAGLVGCWNIPALVKKGGFFSADLRLFQVAPASGEWTKANQTTFSVEVTYDEMTVVFTPRTLLPEEIAASEKGMSDTTLVRPLDTQFTGKLLPALLSKDLSFEQLKVLVTPKVYVEAVTTDGKELKTPVSISGAQYVNGVFSNTADLSQEAAKAVKTMSFVLPGTRIEIVPAGLYFFSAYLFVGCAIFGYGTLERIKFREQYRKRINGLGSG